MGWNLIYEKTTTKIQNIDTNKSFEQNIFSFLIDREDLDLTQQSVLKSCFEDWLLSSIKKESTWNNELYRYIDDWVINQSQSNEQKQKREFMERYYSPLLAFLYSTKNDLIRTKFYCNKSYQIILNQWLKLKSMSTLLIWNQMLIEEMIILMIPKIF